MSPDFINRIVRLVQKTGDRAVLADPQTEKSVVVMSLEEYEKLLDQNSPGEVRSPVPHEAKKSTPIVHVDPPDIPEVTEEKTEPQTENPFKKKREFLSGRSHLTEEREQSTLNRTVRPAAPRYEQPGKKEEVLEDEERFFLESIE